MTDTDDKIRIGARNTDTATVTDTVTESPPQRKISEKDNRYQTQITETDDRFR